MKLGFSLPQSGSWATAENQVAVAQHAEALGYHSLWVFQRLMYPVAPQNDYPPMPGQQWPRAFECVVDPMITLAFVAAVTRRIRLGTSVLIMPFYSPILLAKQVATLDRVAAGRLHVGLAIGWSKDEFDAVGTPFQQRGKRADEFLECLKAIWTDDIVEFRGRFYRVPKARIEPKPVQKPYPPITIGGYSSAAIRRAITYADGFMGGNVPLSQISSLVTQLKELAEAHGRDPCTLQVVSRGIFQLCQSPQGKDRRPLCGTLDEIREDIARYAAAGLTELFLEANLDPDVTVGRVLDVMAALAPRASAI